MYITTAFCFRIMASLEYRNHEDDCGPCLQEGSKKEARYFCENCKSYICDSCKDSHKKFQDLRIHTIVASQKQQHDDSSGPSDLTTSLSELSTQPSDKCNVQRESCKPEDVTNDVSCKPSTSLSETETLSVTTPDKPGDSRESERTGQKYQKPINIIEDVNFHLLTKINIRGLDEKDKSLVGGCCFMSGGEIVLIDGIKVKLLDSSFTLKDVLRMQRCPSGVAALDKDTAVVTAGVQIQVIHVLPSLKKGRSISADKYCEGIDIAADQIYVCCCTPGKEDGEICIYDFELNLKKKIGKKLFSYMFKWPKMCRLIGLARSLF